VSSGRLGERSSAQWKTIRHKHYVEVPTRLVCRQGNNRWARIIIKRALLCCSVFACSAEFRKHSSLSLIIIQRKLKSNILAAMVPIVVVVILAFLTPLGKTAEFDVPRPTEGFQVGPGLGTDIILPLSATQCEPFLIYHNIPAGYDYRMFLYTPDFQIGNEFLHLLLPQGAGYFDWICNIPAGYSFLAYAATGQYYTVQPGSSSACLGDVTTTYPYASYLTDFQSYTQHSPTGNSSISTDFQQ